MRQVKIQRVPRYANTDATHGDAVCYGDAPACSGESTPATCRDEGRTRPEHAVGAALARTRRD